MRLSERRLQDAHNAIHRSVMDARVELRRRHGLDAEADAIVSGIVKTAWSRLKAALNIEEDDR